ncbi:hypothetical protein HPP92_007457 [Vanilla planifolia]|uniref:Terpene synthase N-terminal domain-containing protein n=1 Tax=Vanilla planifolia TaxID=51239 RepID=A0A835RA84_VANPL|nr:hypothetical protein HPP92_007457 [Vanilla planifolia]
MVHLNFEQKLEMAREALTSQLKDPTSAMETLDMLQQLGIDYHFSEEIDTITQSLYQIFSTYNDSSISFMDSLQHVALGFRLLRQYGYYTCPDVFSRFMNKQGHFDVALCQDLRGLLSLYEASQMGIGEDILYKANKFSAENLQACIDHVGVEMGKKIKQALEQPIHLSLPRNTSRQYICQLQREHEMNNLFKEVAIMDFNYVQSLHESEFSEVLRW